MSMQLPSTLESVPHDSKIQLFNAEDECKEVKAKQTDLLQQTDSQNHLSSSSIDPFSSCISHESKRKRQDISERTPRPPNSFMIYRKEKHAEIKSQYQSSKSLNNNLISKVIANMWRQESPEIKTKYIQMADDAKKEHLLKYPDYKYQPRKNPRKSFISDILHPFDLVSSHSTSIQPNIAAWQPIQPHSVSNNQHFYYRHSPSLQNGPDLLTSPFVFADKEYFNSIIGEPCNNGSGAYNNEGWNDNHQRSV